MIRKIDPRKLKWISKPSLYLLNSERIMVETEPMTALHPRGREAEAAELSLAPSGSFCFTCRADFDFQHTFDQCGLILYRNEKRKAVISAECRNDEISRLSCIVYHNDRGDKSMRDIGSAVHSIYYRIWYRSEAVTVQYSFSGSRYTDLRKFWLHLNEDDNVAVGIYACSPADSWFDCSFSKMALEERTEER